MTTNDRQSLDRKPSKIYAEIADALIRWPERVKGCWVTVKASAGVDGVEGHLPEFCQWFCKQNSHYHNQDIDKAAQLFIKDYPDLVAWHQALLLHRQVTVRFSDGEPLIMAEPFSRWLKLTAKHDPDSLIALKLAERLGPSQARSVRRVVAELDRWAMVARFGDPDLLQLLNPGVSDLHVHLGGCVPVPYVWQQLMMKEVRFEMLPTYTRKGSRVGDLPQMKTAQRIWAGTDRDRQLLAQERGVSPVFFTQDGAEAPYAFPLSKVLQPERQMLTGAWYRAIETKNKDEQQADRFRLLRELDTYLAAKRLFLEHHQQSYLDRSPGLPYFYSTYFVAAKPSSQPRPWERERSQRLLNRDYAHRLDMLADTKLKRLEVRISPEQTLEGYVSFLRQWAELEKKLKIAERGLRIHFAIHFKRSLSKGEKQFESLNKGIPLSRLRRLLDKEAAVLHIFRHRCPELAKKIARIDVCGMERDASANIFSFHVNLLRGDQDAHDQLKNPDVRTIEEYAHWRRLSDRDLSWPSEALPELGLTFHAGEDYFHPLDGLYQIDGAIEGMKMRAGDSFGHALALGVDLKENNAVRGEAVHIPRGLQFDCLIWLHDLLIKQNTNYSSAIRRIEFWLEEECRNLYGRSISIESLHRFILRQHGPLAGEKRPEKEETKALWRDRLYPEQDETEELWRDILYDPVIRSNRNQPVMLDSIVTDLNAEIAIAQQAVLKKIIDKGLVVEANPSSNMRVGAFHKESDLPLAIVIRESQDDLRITLNTDNPGVFGTRIENEYAIAWQALSTTLNRPQVMARLDKLRRCGLELPILINDDYPEPRSGAGLS